MKLLNKAFLKAMNKISSFMKEEKGDTNFISILIILAIVVILLGVFMGFKDTIISRVQEVMDGFDLH